MNRPDPNDDLGGSPEPVYRAIHKEVKSHKKDMGVSVAIIARNSEDVIRRCLESVKDADEIVVVDTGSDSDETITIAKEYTDKVYTYYGCNERGKRNGLLENFSDARNKALEYCTMSHILTIDCDEVLMGGMDELKECNDRALSIRCISAHTGEEHRQPRLYLNDPAIRWEGAAHNYLNIAGIKSDIVIKYYSNKQKKKDPDRTMRILQRWIKKNPKNCAREIYYLAKEYHKRSLFKEASKQFLRYVKVSNFAPEKADAFVNLARCYAGMGDRNKAINSVMAAININPTFPEALTLAGDLSADEVRMKYHYLASKGSNENVLFKRNIKKPRITILSYRDFAGSGYRICKAARAASKGKLDIEALNFIQGSTFGMETGVSIDRVGIDIAKERIQTSDIIHFKGDWVHEDKFPEIKGAKGLEHHLLQALEHEQIYLPYHAKKIYTVCGSLFRQKDGTLSDNVAWECYKPEDYKADLLTSTTPDLCYTPDWHYMPFPYSDFQYCFRKRKKFRIVHIPSTPEKKGTDIVRRAIKELEAFRSDFEYIELTGLTHTECLQVKATANIYLDQFIVKAYGNAAVEAMAMGIPVVSAIDKTIYEPHCPVVSPNKTGLTLALDEIMDWGILERLSETTYRYAQDIHGGVGEKWHEVYMKIING